MLVEVESKEMVSIEGLGLHDLAWSELCPDLTLTRASVIPPALLKCDVYPAAAGACGTPPTIRHT